MNATAAEPENGVEVPSARNTRAEMAEKTAAYLAVSAKEVWIIDEDGVPKIHTSPESRRVQHAGFELPQQPAAVRG